MKRVGLTLVGMNLLVLGLNARPMGRPVEVQRPTTSTATVRPVTTAPMFRPTTTNEVTHPTTQTMVLHPQTNVPVMHPTTQTAVVHPQTTVNVMHPQTTVEVLHPQTTVAVFHPQTLDTVQADDSNSMGGKQGTSSSRTAATSMSDFKPMQAKDLSASSTDKAAPTGKGDNNLGNNTNEADKDNTNKTSSLGTQAGASQNLDVDPKQTQLKGLEKIITDRAKVQEKK